MEDVNNQVHIQNLISERIRASHIVLIIPSEYFIQDSWRMFEVKEAKRLCKPIIYIGDAHCKPEIIEPYVDKVTELIQSDITQAIIELCGT